MKGRYVVMWMVLMVPFFSLARDLAGVQLPETLSADRTTLLLNGAGVRSKYGIDGYAAGLYLMKKDRNASRIVAADEPMAVRMVIVSSLITPERMEDALREGFDLSTRGQIAPIREPLERFIAAFRAEIHKGDRFDVIYLPGVGVRVLRNGVVKATEPGLLFKQAVFGTWLGESPVQDSLKRALLGE